jgi:hypothetical protein
MATSAMQRTEVLATEIAGVKRSFRESTETVADFFQRLITEPTWRRWV